MSAEADETNVQVARLRSLFDQAPLTLGVTLLIAAMTALTLAGTVGWKRPLLWFLAVAASAALRTWLCARFWRDAGGARSPRIWWLAGVAGAALGGCVWGAAALALLPGAPEESRFFFAFVVGGMCAGTTAVNSACFPAVAAFVLTATLPLIAAFASRGTQVAISSAGMIAVFASALLLASLRAHWAFGRGLALQMALSERGHELAEANAHLLEEVEERRQMEVRLHHAQKMEAIGLLAGGIVHDFNNVVQTVEGATKLIAERTEEPEVRRLATLAGDAAARGASVTRRLLAFARRETLQAESFDVRAMLLDLRQMLSSTLGPGISVAIETASPLPPAMADRAQLETVLVNLAANSRDAMPEGGEILLAAAAGPGPGKLRPGTYVRLSLTDCGHGMSADVLAHAAEPFFTTKPAGAGTGLGLSMARDFAEQSGGMLEISSTEGAGTVVRLWLPAAPEPVAPEPTPDRETHVLLVDDDAFVREVLSEQLVAHGYTVTAAPNANAALARLAQGETPDAILVDYNMPDMNGATLIRQLRAHRPNLPALLLTGSTSSREALGIGPDLDAHFRLLRKPVTTRHLVQALNAVLGESAGARLHPAEG